MKFIEFAKFTIQKSFENYVNLRWMRRTYLKRKRHKLPNDLIISVTSFPARYPTLPLTLKCLLTQSVQPDRVILWLSEKEASELTREILELRQDGLEIKICDDHRSYKKIIPALNEYPDAFLVTADDDCYYWATWLDGLTSEFDSSKKEVLCHRAHEIVVGTDGYPLPYSNWRHNVKAGSASSLLFPTGVGGVLYRPGIFDQLVKNSELYLRLAPRADDAWLYFMASLNGAKFRKVGPRRTIVPWPQTQMVGLRTTNLGPNGENDVQIQNLISKFGFFL
ncbi:glycosyltransferase family 2 protein [Pannonibacter phragmitetus]|uniref:glycosyltransferase family 2 protein n=1 Tax=Pannonibacter phragmitetus TaxID=121719 RepID=UPI0013CE4A2C|nr:glycosyltransferase family 2 protein [Pannonibacter phragmitetus]